MRPLTKKVSHLLCIVSVAGILSAPLNAFCEQARIVTSKTHDKTKTGLRVYEPSKSYGGYTLLNHLSTYTPSDSDPEAAAKLPINPIFLLDMDGNIAHKWMVDNSVSFARLQPDGTLLYITNNFPTPERPYDPGDSGIRRIDDQSNVRSFIPTYTQHDFRVLENGNYLIEYYGVVNDERFGNETVFIQRIAIITANGDIIWEWKTEDHIEELEQLTGSKLNLKNNYFFTSWSHNNTVEVMGNNLSGKKDPRFKSGNILFSLPHSNIIGVIEYPSGKIVWAWGPGILDAQHQPSMLENGRILLFDNGKKRGWSRIVEIDPIAEKVVWEYHATPKEGFYSPILSGVTRLPNGNTFICEGTSNRLFEITPDGEIVWDYISVLDRKNNLGIIRSNRYSPEQAQQLFK